MSTSKEKENTSIKIEVDSVELLHLNDNNKSSDIKDLSYIKENNSDMQCDIKETCNGQCNTKINHTDFSKENSDSICDTSQCDIKEESDSHCDTKGISVHQCDTKETSDSDCDTKGISVHQCDTKKTSDSDCDTKGISVHQCDTKENSVCIVTHQCTRVVEEDTSSIGFEFSLPEEGSARKKKSSDKINDDIGDNKFDTKNVSSDVHSDNHSIGIVNSFSTKKELTEHQNTKPTNDSVIATKSTLDRKVSHSRKESIRGKQLKLDALVENIKSLKAAEQTKDDNELSGQRLETPSQDYDSQIKGSENVGESYNDMNVTKLDQNKKLSVNMVKTEMKSDVDGSMSNYDVTQGCDESHEDVAKELIKNDDSAINEQRSKLIKPPVLQLEGQNDSKFYVFGAKQPVVFLGERVSRKKTVDDTLPMQLSNVKNKKPVKKIEMIRHPCRRVKRVASLNALAMVNILFGKDESPPKSQKSKKVITNKSLSKAKLLLEAKVKSLLKKARTDNKEESDMKTSPRKPSTKKITQIEKSLAQLSLDSPKRSPKSNDSASEINKKDVLQRETTKTSPQRKKSKDIKSASCGKTSSPKACEVQSTTKQRKKCQLQGGKSSKSSVAKGLHSTSKEGSVYHSEPQSPDSSCKLFPSKLLKKNKQKAKKVEENSRRKKKSDEQASTGEKEEKKPRKKKGELMRAARTHSFPVQKAVKTIPSEVSQCESCQPGTGDSDPSHRHDGSDYNKSPVDSCCGYGVISAGCVHCSQSGSLYSTQGTNGFIIGQAVSPCLTISPMMQYHPLGYPIQYSSHVPHCGCPSCYFYTPAPSAVHHDPCHQATSSTIHHDTCHQATSSAIHHDTCVHHDQCHQTVTAAIHSKKLHKCGCEESEIDVVGGVFPLTVPNAYQQEKEKETKTKNCKKQKECTNKKIKVKKKCEGDHDTVKKRKTLSIVKSRKKKIENSTETKQKKSKILKTFNEGYKTEVEKKVKNSKSEVKKKSKLSTENNPHKTSKFSSKSEKKIDIKLKCNDKKPDAKQNTFIGKVKSKNDEREPRLVQNEVKFIEKEKVKTNNKQSEEQSKKCLYKRSQSVDSKQVISKTYPKRKRTASLTSIETLPRKKPLISVKKKKGECKKKRNHSWEFSSAPEKRQIMISGSLSERFCYSAIKHTDGDSINVRDVVLLRSGPKKTDIPFLAKVTAFWEENDEMMMSLLWYYHPEHTDTGRQPHHLQNEIFASKHRDENSVACIDDKGYVLTYNEYCRYRAERCRAESNLPPRSMVVPVLEENPRRMRMPPLHADANTVYMCRQVYDFKLKRILKNPA